MVNNVSTNQLKTIYDHGDISKIKFHNNKFELFVMWDNYPPKPNYSQFDHIIIEADYIEWKNLPDLVNPMDD